MFKSHIYYLLSMLICLALSACISEVVNYQDQTLNLNLNDCINDLQLENLEVSCAPELGSEPQGCLVIQTHQGQTDVASIVWDNSGISLLNNESMNLNLSTDEGHQHFYSVYLFANGGNCNAYNIETPCEGACVVSIIKQPLVLQEDNNSLFFSSNSCPWVNNTNLGNANDEIACDEKDNDCDGMIDEGYEVGATCSKGMGICFRQGVLTCVEPGQEPKCNAEEIAPQEREICDQEDNDCDGLIDETFSSSIGNECTFGFGNCEQEGTLLCVTEESQSYLGGNLGDILCHPNESLIQATANETGSVSCDGEDNDCDGRIDEDFIRNSVACGVGACGARGQESCLMGMIETSCRDGDPQNSDQTCDGTDDDCNGKVDEDYIPLSIPCGLGVCTRMIEVTCEGGDLNERCQPLTPNPNALDNECDGLDNDCDGNIDESFMNRMQTCGVGACLQTVEISCNNGVQTVCTPSQPNTNQDECDGIDNDCDGIMDEDYTPTAITCGVGECEQNGQRLCRTENNVTTPRNVCTPLETNVTVDLCDGLDNDCDGSVDENHHREAVNCGLGDCYQEGYLECEGGVVRSSCQQVLPEINERDESCNNRDEDCDGLNDEGYIRTLVDCLEEGSCAETGLSICQNGIVGDTCRVATAMVNTDVTCDGIDDDCDGNVDEDYTPTAIICGLGICVNNGFRECINGSEQNNCTPYNSLSLDQSCDGQDNDCDGDTDEGFIPIPITCGEGICQRAGNRICESAEIVTQCDIADIDVPDTQCDGLDNDCDGSVDEAYNSVVTECGIGACSRTGLLICVTGNEVDTCQVSNPNTNQDHTCNNIDEDCDGNTDENYVARTISCGIGACYNQTQTECINGEEIEDCDPNDSTGNDQNCNNIDEDCDGSTDEGFVPEPVECMSCNEDGETRCNSQGIIDTTCTDELSEVDSTCDGVDDDCDQRIDEDYNNLLNEPVVCGLGICERTGNQLICDDGEVVLDCTPGNPEPNDNTCNNIDEDCDGNSDEGYSNTLSCGVGACFVTVTQTCANGTFSPPMCTPGNPGVEVCGDNIDNDCDGIDDEGEFPTLGDNCNVGIGACQRTGEIICNQTTTRCNVIAGLPSTEICDGLDNDCNGITDDNPLSVGTLCVNENNEGICRQGTYLCVGGNLQCDTPIQDEFAEIPCDDLDNDCDGNVDEETINETLVLPDDDCGNPCTYQCREVGVSMVCRNPGGNVCE